MMTKRDPWVNLLRVTSATFAAAVGGADSITALPFDHALGASDELALRMARNTHLLLAEESNVGRVIDPAGGSFFVESLTEQLAERGWSAFQGLESDGGMALALVDGKVEDFLDQQWDARRSALATRREPITGVSEFPLVSEERVDRPSVDPRSVRAEATGVETHVSGEPTTCEPLPSRRLAGEIEALRDRADALAETGSRPRIFLANLGPVAAHTARSTWAANFYEAGGVEALANDGFDNADDLAAAFEASGARAAVICSSDDVYADWAADAARALAGAGAERVALAGRPGDLEPALRDAGVTVFVHVGVDQLAELGALFDVLGVAL